jgi:hypothetical protein
VRIGLSIILHRLEENFLSKVYVINLRNLVCSSLSKHRSSSIGITIRLRVGDATFELALLGSRRNIATVVALCLKAKN